MIEVIQKPEKVYSTNDEYFNDDNIDDVLDEALFNALDDGMKVGEQFTIYEGDSIRYTHSNFINMPYLIEIIQESAYDNGGEHSEDYLSDLTHEKAKELEALIVDWFNENVAKPTLYSVENIKEVETKISQKMFDEFHNPNPITTDSAIVRVPSR